MTERIKEAKKLALRFAQSVHGDQSVDEAQSHLYRYLEQVIPHWQPIETAPMDGSDILVLSSSGFIHQASWWIEEVRADTITHWMSLPPPPQQ